MKSLQHFAYAFLHLFTFVIMLYLYNVMPDFIRQVNAPGLWFMCLIIMVNAFMGGAHLTWFVKAMNKMAELPAPCYED